MPAICKTEGSIYATQQNRLRKRVNLLCRATDATTAVQGRQITRGNEGTAVLSRESGEAAVCNNYQHTPHAAWCRLAIYWQKPLDRGKTVGASAPNCARVFKLLSCVSPVLSFLSLTIDMPLVTVLVPPTRAPMKGVATNPSETLSPVRGRGREEEQRVTAQVQHQTETFLQHPLQM